jgi:hypothetical protein
MSGPVLIWGISLFSDEALKKTEDFFSGLCKALQTLLVRTVFNKSKLVIF